MSDLYDFDTDPTGCPTLGKKENAEMHHSAVLCKKETKYSNYEPTKGFVVDTEESEMTLNCGVKVTVIRSNKTWRAFIKHALSHKNGNRIIHIGNMDELNALAYALSEIRLHP